ncbi:TPA: GDP-mannose 4,6-dehydratase, partial [Vibrio cholerae]
SRDFVYIDDVVDSIVLSIFKEEANFQVFNVGSGVSTDVIKVATTLKNIYQSSSNIFIGGNFRLGDIRHNFADLTLINSKLGFEPKISFDAGIKKFTSWVNQQEVKSDLYDSSIAEMKEKGLYK